METWWNDHCWHIYLNRVCLLNIVLLLNWNRHLCILQQLIFPSVLMITQQSRSNYLYLLMEIWALIHSTLISLVIPNFKFNFRNVSGKSFLQISRTLCKRKYTLNFHILCVRKEVLLFSLLWSARTSLELLISIYHCLSSLASGDLIKWSLFWDLFKYNVLIDNG